MRIAEVCGKRCPGKARTVLICLLAVFLACSVGSVLAATGGEHGEAAHGDEGGHGGKGWVNTDWYRVMNFTVLAVGLFFLLRKPVSQGLNSRIQGIKDQLNDLESRKADAEKTLAEYNQKFATLEKDKEKIIAQYTRQGQEAKARILEEAKSAADKLEAQAQKNIENEFKRARAELQEEILQLAMEKAEALIQSKITAEDQEKLVDEYLAKVVA